MPILFNSLTYIVAEFPTSDFIFIIVISAKIKNVRELSIPKKTDWTTCLCPFYSPVYDEWIEAAI